MKLLCNINESPEGGFFYFYDELDMIEWEPQDFICVISGDRRVAAELQAFISANNLTLRLR